MLAVSASPANPPARSRARRSRSRPPAGPTWSGAGAGSDPQRARRQICRPAVPARTAAFGVPQGCHAGAERAFARSRRRQSHRAGRQRRQEPRSGVARQETAADRFGPARRATGYRRHPRARSGAGWTVGRAARTPGRHRAGSQDFGREPSRVAGARLRRLGRDFAGNHRVQGQDRWRQGLGGARVSGLGADRVFARRVDDATPGRAAPGQARRRWPARCAR